MTTSRRGIISNFSSVSLSSYMLPMMMVLLLPLLAVVVVSSTTSVEAFQPFSTTTSTSTTTKLATIRRHYESGMSYLCSSSGLAAMTSNNAFYDDDEDDDEANNCFGVYHSQLHSYSYSSSCDNLRQYRKQKASDRRTRRMQRGGASSTESSPLDVSTPTTTNGNGSSRSRSTTVTVSPMQQAGQWNTKRIVSTTSTSTTSTSSRRKNNRNSFPTTSTTTTTSSGQGQGRSRSKKRSQLYSSLATYQNQFFQLLTEEYQIEENEVMNRILSSVDDPLALELSGHAMYDMIVDRRGTLFADDIYRLTKAPDAVTNYISTETTTKSRQQQQQHPSSTSSSLLPSNHKFTPNDVILLTLQPNGSGDVFDKNNLPTSESAISTEARVVSTGPTYIDIAIPSGMMDATFAVPTSSTSSSSGNNVNVHYDFHLRIDRFFSDVPYRRMVDAVTSMASIPARQQSATTTTLNQRIEDGSKSSNGSGNPKHTKGSGSGGQRRNSNDNNTPKSRKQQQSPPSSPAPPAHANICMDEVLREVIISTHSFTDPSSPLFHDMDSCDLQTLGRIIAKPPMPTSVKLANEVLRYVQSNSMNSNSPNNNNIFKPLNAPQLAAVGAALTRKLTLIQGPPGTGKTSAASVIGFGFTHQCRSISRNAKVLATAFSNVGADNLAEGFMGLGLKVIRIGKASAVSQNLWDSTLDAAIARDPEAQSALENAARATAELTRIRTDRKKQQHNRKGGTSSTNFMLNERAAQDIATAAVKRSIHACNVAATKAIREADIVVSTSTGAADPRLLAACGLNVDTDSWMDEKDDNNYQRKDYNAKAKMGGESTGERTSAPDGLPPISLPFVIVDEACQSVEPATLIPLTASNSCRSLVMLGDPCQLPATVKSDPSSPLSISLMERLAAALPAPMIKMKDEVTTMDRSFLESLPVRQAKSLLRSRSTEKAQDDSQSSVSYRKRFAGSLLLSIQYRMHPSIAALPSAIFYDGLLSTPAGLEVTRPFPPVLNEMLPCDNPRINVRFLNVGGRCNEKRGDGKNGRVLNDSSIAGQAETTFQNEAEAIQVIEIIKKMLLFDHQYDPTGRKTIGVVTPYSGQVQLIKSMIESDTEITDLLSSSMGSTTIEVNSVDGYQGRERDVVIFSAVRSNRKGNVGFLSDWRRLNVALTRSKSALLLVGDMDTLVNDRHFDSFIKWCRGTGCIVDEINTGETEA